jgi:hypothetical protein
MTQRPPLPLDHAGRKELDLQKVLAGPASGTVDFA